jgi:hypothetical protein
MVFIFDLANTETMKIKKGDFRQEKYTKSIFISHKFIIALALRTFSWTADMVFIFDLAIMETMKI